MTNCTKHMKLALKLAQKGKPSPNPKVGCVITKFGFVVGKGYHKGAGRPHAEIEALRGAGRLARKGAMYITLEPCTHYGKTPPCVNAIIKSGIKRVIIAMKDPNPAVSGGGVQKLRKAGIKVKVGVLKNQAILLNKAWIKYITTKKPFVTLKAAISLDGKIATKTGDSKWITGIKSRHHAHILRDINDAIVVGIKTVLKDNPLLTARVRNGKDPLRVILDSKLRIPLEANVLNDGNVLIVTTNKHNQEKKKILDKHSYDILVMDDKKIILSDLISELAKRDLTSVLIEGGSEVLTSAIKEGIADRAIFFIAPKIIGGSSLSVFKDMGVERISDALHLQNVSVRKLDNDVAVEVLF